MEQLDLMCPHGLPGNEACVDCDDAGVYDSVERSTSTNHFDGETAEECDRPRLNTQLRNVFDFMRPGGPHTLGEIAEAVGGSEAGVSARLRDFRKARFGGHVVERIRVEGGLFEYRLVANGELR